MNYRKAAVYVASALIREEVVKAGLQRIVPVRKFTKGARPGVNSKELWDRCKVKAKDYEERKVMNTEAHLRSAESNEPSTSSVQKIKQKTQNSNTEDQGNKSVGHNSHAP